MVKTPNSTKKERMEYILQTVKLSNYVPLREIAQKFDVNIQTARRDISMLYEQGLVGKVHGGAVPFNESDVLSVDERLNVNYEEKRQIARIAADFVNDGDVIFLDGGSTTAFLAPFLLNKHINVVTNSIPIISILKNAWPNVEIIATGGYYYPKSELFLGIPAVQSLKNIKLNKAFISSAGITAEGIYNSNMLVVELEQAVLANATQTYLLADSSKLGRESLARICGLEDIFALISTNPIPESILQKAKQSNTQLIFT